MFLSNILRSKGQITTQSVKQSTELPVAPLSQKWFEIRRIPGNISASAVGDCLGVNVYNCGSDKMGIMRTFNRIRRPTKDFISTENFFTRWGDFYEPISLTLFHQTMRKNAIRSNLFQHPTLKWLYATPDALVDDDAILEIKNPHRKLHEEPMAHYISQMQIQMLCTQRRKGFFMSTCIAKDSARIWSLNLSEEYCKWMIPQLRYFRHTAINPNANLDLEMFDQSPPQVPFTLVAQIDSIRSIINVPEFDEPYPGWEEDQDVCLFHSFFSFPIF
eukprot:TRINITY_DN3534_c0_g1_i3.p1 TRINITY_DN3534_c0_g1~~TRINITY_DN3534_c0_g1_i3.p1  ORF type:complete len:274 (-),score=70.95 TRINITY_DN3534_c0_g1_i3:271-1092(-)